MTTTEVIKRPTVNSIITNLLNDYEYDAPEDVVDDVLKMIPKDELIEYVRTPILQEIRRNFYSRSSGPLRRPTPAGTSKWRALKNSLYDQQVMVVKEWKKIGDLTVSDLGALAQQRRERADGYLAMAERYDALAKYMKQQGAKQLRQLPEEDVRLALPNGDAA